MQLAAKAEPPAALEAPRNESGPVGYGKEKAFHIPSLDGLRGIAFLLVFVAHAGAKELVPGGFGVTVFFFLSGYLITTLLRREAAKTGTVSLSKFYIRRCRRILPPMYITLGLAFGLGKLGLLTIRGQWSGAVASIFYFYNYLELVKKTSTLLPFGTGVVWSLMIEEHFYLVFPFMYMLFIANGLKRKAQTGVVTALCALPLISRCVAVFVFHSPLTTMPRWTYSATDARFDSILWGCALAICFNPWFKDAAGFLGRYKGWLAAAGLGAIVFSLLIRDPYFRETLRYSLQSIALFPIFYYVIDTRSVWTQWLDWEPLAQIGQLSYAMYLCHDVFLGVVRTYVSGGAIVWSAAAMSLSILYAMAMRAWVERPLRRWIP